MGTSRVGSKRMLELLVQHRCLSQRRRVVDQIQESHTRDLHQ